MSEFDNKGPDCKCSFCGKNQDEVEKLIAGPDVYICDECIELCNEIVLEEDEGVDQLDGHDDFQPGTLKPMEGAKTFTSSATRSRSRSVTAHTRVLRVPTNTTPEAETDMCRASGTTA